MPAKKVSEVYKTVSEQLHTVHNPFAGLTSQPKIPDGKVNDSLGFETSTVREIKNSAAYDTIHMLMFAGQNAMLIWEGGNAGLSRNYEIPGFTGSGSVDWSKIVDTTGGLVVDPESYGLWRVVSAGMQLKLLNPVEEDDGWWEAIRVSDGMNAAGWRLTTTDNSSNRAANGTIAPVEYLQRYKAIANMSNDTTYSTGLLRDLHRVQFELHGRMDYHDFTNRRTEMFLPDDSFLNYSIITEEGIFQDGHDDAHELIDNFVDKSYDMVYLRLHCRSNDGEDNRGSRFHMHLCSNQEIYFPQEARENRFHTKGETVGAEMMSIHFQGRRSLNNAATLIG